MTDWEMLVLFALMAGLVLAGWVAISQLHLYFGLLWLPLGLLAARKARTVTT